MKTRLLFIQIIFFSCFSLFAQERQPDYILKKNSNDTIWCKITLDGLGEIHYTEKQEGKTIDKNEVSYFKWNSNKYYADSKKLDSLKEAEKVSQKVREKQFKKYARHYSPPDSIINARPKILLTILSSSSYTSPTTYYGGGGGVKSGGGTHHRIVYGFIDPEVGPRKLGWRMKNLEKYIKTDPEAYRAFKALRTAGSVQKISFWTCLGAAIPAAILVGNSDNDEIDPMVRPLMGIAIISGVTYLTTLIIPTKTLKECVKIYNKNSGHGYINGLEKQ